MEVVATKCLLVLLVIVCASLLIALDILFRRLKGVMGRMSDLETRIVVCAEDRISEVEAELEALSNTVASIDCEINESKNNSFGKP